MYRIIDLNITVTARYVDRLCLVQGKISIINGLSVVIEIDLHGGMAQGGIQKDYL